MNHLESLRRRSGAAGRRSPDAITVKYTAHADDNDDEDNDIAAGIVSSTPGISVSVAPHKSNAPHPTAAAVDMPATIPASVNTIATVVNAIHISDDSVAEIMRHSPFDHESLAEMTMENIVPVAKQPVITVVDDTGTVNSVPGGGADFDSVSLNSTASGVSTSTHTSGGKRKWLSNLKQKIEHKFEKIEHKIEEKIDNLKSDKTGPAGGVRTSLDEKVRNGITRSPSDLSTDSSSSKKHLGRIYESDNDKDNIEAEDSVSLHVTSSTLESECLIGGSATAGKSGANKHGNRKTSTASSSRASDATALLNADGTAPVRFMPKVDRNVIKVQTDLLQRCLNPADDYESDSVETSVGNINNTDIKRPFFGSSSAGANGGEAANGRRPSETRISASGSSASLIQRGGLRSTSIAYDPTIRGRQGAKPPKSIQFETIVEGVQKRIRRDRHFQPRETPSEKKRQTKQRSSKSKRGGRKEAVGETASDTNSADEAGAKDVAGQLIGRVGSRQSITSLMKGHAMSRSLPSLAELPSSSDTEQQQQQQADADTQSHTSININDEGTETRRDNINSRDAGTDSSSLPVIDSQQQHAAQRFVTTSLNSLLDMWPANVIMQHSSLWIFVGLFSVFVASWLSSSTWNFLSGFLVGLVSAGVVLYKVMKPLAALLNVATAKTSAPSVMSTSQAVNFASDLIVQRRDNKVADKKVFEAWMLEFTGDYKEEDFVITDTHLIFIRLDGPILRIQRPKHEYLAHKIALDEKLPKAPTFVHQRIIDLDKSRVMLHPEKLSNSQRWNRKYPIVILAQQMVTSTKTQSKRKANKDGVGGVSSTTSEKKQDVSSSGTVKQQQLQGSPKPSALHQRRTSVKPSTVSSSTTEPNNNNGLVEDGFEVVTTKDVQEERLLLFARTNRQKEQWYWLLRKASKQGCPEMSLVPDIRLYQSPNFTPLNALIHRLFADALSEKAWHDVIEFIIEDKLSKVALPTWIGDFKMSQLQLGKRIPLLSDVCDKPVYNEMGLWLDVWFEYHGGLTFRLETKLNLMELKRNTSPTRTASKNLATSSDDAGSMYDGGAPPSSPSATSAGSMMSPTSSDAGGGGVASPSSEYGGVNAMFAREFDEIPFILDADGNLCETPTPVNDADNVDVYSDAALNFPPNNASSYRGRFNSDAGNNINNNSASSSRDAGGSSKAFDTASMASSSSTVDDSRRSSNMTITTTTTSTHNKSGKQQATDGAAEMKRNKFLRFVDKIAQSKYFQSATENKYIKKAMEGVSKTPLTLQVELQRISGRLQINIPPPPSDKLWWGFAPTPHIDLNARPFYGDKEVKTTQVIAWIEKRLVSEINKLVTSPNFDDVTIPFMNNHIHTYEQRLSKLKDVFL